MSTLERIRGQERTFNEQSSVPPEVSCWFPIPERGQVNHSARIRPERIDIPENAIDSLDDYIHNVLQEVSGYSKPELDGVIVGLSGGIDSTTTAALCKHSLEGSKHFVKGLVMGRGPEGEQGDMNDVELQDVAYAIQSARDMGIDYEYIDISPLINTAAELFPNVRAWEMSGLLPRIRSILLYQKADNNNAVCAGTTNGSEYILGAFTYGGPAGHFQPFVDFYKSEVYEIARMLDVPGYIRKRKAGVSELGLYEEQLYGVDCYIMDPILRRLNYQEQTPEEVATELRHDVEWLTKIKDLRIEGEKGRKSPPSFVVGREIEVSIEPDIVFDRDKYFNDLFD